MLNGFMRLAACVASGAAFLALTGCGGSQPNDGYAGPPPSSYDRGGSAPVLMGQTPAARPADGTGLLGGPDGYAGMAPIPNPADLTKAERVRYYGHKYDHLPEPKGRKATATGGARYPLIQRRRADGTMEISMRPIANPEDMSAAERRAVYGSRYAPRPVSTSPRRFWEPAPKPAKRVTVATPARPAAAKPAAKPAAAVKPAAKPVAVAPAPKPVVAAPAPKPATLAKAPAAPVAVAPKPVAATPAQKLSAAVHPEVMKGAVLTVPEGLAKGEESKVSLSLPGDLFAIIKREAAKLGLGKAARKAEVTATLTGDGYEITPAQATTKKLKDGEAATFDWNVKPGEGAKAPLKATVDGTLTGDRKARTTFSLATLEQAVVPVVEDAKAAAKGFKWPKLSLGSLAIPGMKAVEVPGVGKVGSEKLVGAGLALLALILVIAMARGASANRARAERRRKFRTMQDSSHGGSEAETVSQPYVNPMIAAAGGAAAGAGAMHFASDHGHDDHGNGHGHDAHADTHGHADDHGHGDHGHDAHAAHGGHDDHHGHDAHPASHHPEAQHDDHAHDAHAADHGHDAHADHGHDAHGHGHDDHGHGHDAHPVSHHAEHHDAHGHAPADAHAADHGHDDHGHHAPADHGHHPEPAHA